MYYEVVIQNIKMERGGESQKIAYKSKLKGKKYFWMFAFAGTLFIVLTARFL
jgi:hypothetical protein